MVASTPSRRTHVASRVVLAICLIVFAARAFASLRQESATWDETNYFGLGKYLLQQQRWDVPGVILHPPLSFYLHSIPLMFVETDASIWTPDRSRVAETAFIAQGALDRGRALLSSPANAGDRLLTSARLMMVLVGTLLGWVVFAWASRLYGPWSGMLAVVLYTCCPNILANARLVTPDITLTACACAAVFFLWRFLVSARRLMAVAAGLCLGLTLLAKFSGILLLPVFVVLMALWRLKRGRIDYAGCLIVGGLALFGLAAGYGFDVGNYLVGLRFQQAHAAGRHPSFLMGSHEGGWWYYFFVAFVLKTPIAALVFIAAAAVKLTGRWRRMAWLDEAFLILPAAGFFVFFSINQQAIGLRYVLPAFPFLFVLASQVVSRVDTMRRFGRVAAGVLVVWYVAAGAWVHPHYLAYFNELAGGPANGYNYLVDSNLDWGQDLKGLKRFMEERGIDQIKLSYFGSDLPERYGIDYRWLPSYLLKNPNRDVPDMPPRGWVAISATNLQGVYFRDHDIFASFRNRVPEARIGYSIFVYRVD